MSTKSKRSVCYQARDKYFECLDKHQIVSSRQPTDTELLKGEANMFRRLTDKTEMQVNDEPKGPFPQECISLKQVFQDNCMASWVKHFELLRERDAVVKILERNNIHQFGPQNSTTRVNSL